MTPIDIPRRTISGLSVPRLILGDHGFLRRYGSRLTSAQITYRMRSALVLGAVGISAGDERVLRAAARADAPWTLHHTDVAFLSDGRRGHFGRCMATLYERLITEHPRFVSADPLMGAFIMRFKRFRPYESAMKLVNNPSASARIASIIQCYKPAMTSIGGDYLDAMLSLGKIDDAKAAIMPLLDACRQIESIPVLTTYLAAVLDPEDLCALTDSFSALMIPMNDVGVAMLPCRDMVIRRINELGKPILAMHTLAAGLVDPAAALTTVLACNHVAAAVVGATSLAHIEALMQAAHKVFDQQREEVPYPAK